MPPKKNVVGSTSAKPAKEKLPKGRKPKEKVEKPKLKTPAVIRVKLPLAKLRESGEVNTNGIINKGNASPELSPAVKRKIELANEVAQAQLGKPRLEPLNLIEEVANTVKKRPGRKKKIDEDANLASGTKKQTKKVVRKTPIKAATEKNSDNAPKAVNKRKADSTSNQQPKRRSIRKKLVKEESEVTKAETIPEQKPIVTKKGKNVEKVKSPSEAPQTPCILTEATKILKNKATETSSPEKTKISASPAAVDSRKTSTSDCLSWTRDISSSSTTTCMTIGANDFKKKPVIMLANIDNEWKKIQKTRSEAMDSSDSESSSSDCDSTSCSSSISNSASNSLNLSMSSITPVKSVNNTKEPTKREQAVAIAVEKLKNMNLKELRFIRYQDENIDTNIVDTSIIDAFQEKIFRRLPKENDLLNWCRAISNCLRSDRDQGDSNWSPSKEMCDPKLYSDKSEDENFTSSRSKFVMLEQNCADDENPLQVPKVDNESSEEEFSTHRDSYIQFDRAHDDDDDDALSLFAESLTGLESSKYNSSANSICANVSEIEEYVPQATVSRQHDVIPKYIPTKINFSAPQDKPDCETQTADSTFKDNGYEKSQLDVINLKNSSSQTITTRAASKVKPLLLRHIHKPLCGVKSVVFRGVCFYNLISNCKKIKCVFPHELIDDLEMTNRLSKLTEDYFVQEYMLLRNWPTIRRKYGLIFVHECVNRKLTRVLVEMNIDFTAKAKQDSIDDAALKIHVGEKTLLYLNDKGLSECDDLLQYDFGNDLLLCDTFVNMIAMTQNFSRFKVVFIKLVTFMANIGRKFPLDDANNILERVCILPYEEQLAQAVLQIIENTNPAIFNNSMMPQFENQLMVNNSVWYNHLCSLKERINGDLKEDVIVTPSDQNGKTTGDEMFIMPMTESPQLENLGKLPDEAAQKPATQVVIRPTIFNRVLKMNDIELPNVETPPPYNIPPPKRPWPGPHMDMNPMRRKRMRINPMGRMSNGTPGRFTRANQRVMRPPALNRRIDRPVDQRVAYAPNGEFRKFPRRSGPDFF